MIGRLLRPDTIPLLCMQPSNIGSQRQLQVRAYEHPRYPHQSGGFVGAMGNAERRRLNELYYAYLRAGQVCLEARGYQVSR